MTSEPRTPIEPTNTPCPSRFGSSLWRTEREQFLGENAGPCYGRDIVGHRPLAGTAGLRDEAMELEVIAERGAERIDSIRSRSVLAGPARTGNRDGGELSATADPAPYGRPGPWTLDSPGPGAAGKRPGADKRESPGNGAASLWKGSIGARKT